MKHDYPGLFITVEGIDGAGKSEVVDSAEKRLHSVVASKEPSPHWTGPQVRNAINDDHTHPMTDFHFFLGDRAYHMKHSIIPALEAGRTFISDRYTDSTRAYQQEVLDEVVDDPERYIEASMQEWVIEPDLTILIDISAETAAKRTSDGDKYEASDFLRKVRKNYLDLEAENDRIIRVDGEQDKSKVLSTCTTIINEAQVQASDPGYGAE